MLIFVLKYDLSIDKKVFPISFIEKHIHIVIDLHLLKEFYSLNQKLYENNSSFILMNKN